MRKILWICAICLFLIAMGTSGFHQNALPGEEANPVSKETAMPEPDLLREVKRLTVTAVGDCTLGTDINGSGTGSFVNEVKNQNSDYGYFLKNVRSYFENDDLTIVNFEGTLSDRGTRQNKQFAFRGDPEYVRILSESSVEAANLANNHSRDYGAQSREDTVRYLTEAGLDTFVGSDTVIKEYNGVKTALVGIYALNDDKNKLEEIMQSVMAQNPEITIVSFHWGVEKAVEPTAEQKTLAHKAVDLGADLVIGHHPHVLQGVEKYNGKYICYSLGNFCFGGNKNPSDKDTMIFRQTFVIDQGEVRNEDDIEIIPCSISSVSSRNNYQPTPVEGAQKDRIIRKLTDYSKKLGTELKFE